MFQCSTSGCDDVDDEAPKLSWLHRFYTCSAHTCYLSCCHGDSLSVSASALQCPPSSTQLRQPCVSVLQHHADLRLRTSSNLFCTAAASTSLSSAGLNSSGRRVLVPALISMVSPAQTKLQARRTRTNRKVYPRHTSKSPTCTHTQST